MQTPHERSCKRGGPLRCFGRAGRCSCAFERAKARRLAQRRVHTHVVSRAAFSSSAQARLREVGAGPGPGGSRAPRAPSGTRTRPPGRRRPAAERRCLRARRPGCGRAPGAGRRVRGRWHCRRPVVPPVTSAPARWAVATTPARVSWAQPLAGTHILQLERCARREGGWEAVGAARRRGGQRAALAIAPMRSCHTEDHRAYRPTRFKPETAQMDALSSVLIGIGVVSTVVCVSWIVTWAVLKPWSAEDRDHAAAVAALPFPLFFAGCWTRHLGARLSSLVPSPMLAVDVAAAFLKSQARAQQPRVGDGVRCGARARLVRASHRSPPRRRHGACTATFRRAIELAAGARFKHPGPPGAVHPGRAGRAASPQGRAHDGPRARRRLRLPRARRRRRRRPRRRRRVARPRARSRRGARARRAAAAPAAAGAAGRRAGP
jgi:hypothetical protein